MLLTIIITCEIGFWVLLGAGFITRYVFRLPRVGAALLLAVPVVDLVLLGASVLHLSDEATTADFTHGLAAAYLGYTVAFGHMTVKSADVRFAHRFAGGPAPVKPPRRGRARAQHEWRIWRRATLAWAVACGLLLSAIGLVGDPDRTVALADWIVQLTVLLGIAFLWPAYFSLSSARDGNHVAEPEVTRRPKPL